jgi:hypothetical protein
LEFQLNNLEKGDTIMAGQPNFPGWLVFDVTALNSSDIIVDAGTSFDLMATFDGSGVIWGDYESDTEPYTVSFYAERIGTGAINLGSASGNLAAVGGPYTATLNTSIAAEGLYRIGCTVMLDNHRYVAGFQEGLLQQVHP